MKNATVKLCFCAVLSLTIGMACRAQEASPPALKAAASLTREQQGLLDKQDRDIGQAGANIVKMIDESRTGEVWDTASVVAQKIVTRDQFMQKVTEDRAALGTPGMRMPMGVRHLEFDGSGTMPAGRFITVAFNTQFSQTDKTSREIVTFVLDPDDNWRFAGYSVR